jgi:hypothetical protein
MEFPHLKFAIQGPEEKLSGTLETNLEHIDTRGVRFRIAADALVRLGLSPYEPLGLNLVVMFLYLQQSQLPIRAIGRILSFDTSQQDRENAYVLSVDFHEISDEDIQRIQRHLDLKAIKGAGADERRENLRRQSDLFVRELSSVLEILAKMSEGKKENFGEQYSRLVGMQNPLGRRDEDKRLGNRICYFLERLASNLARMVGSEAGLRKVKIRKVTGKDEAAVAKDKIFTGWEESPPQVGKGYCLYLEGGGVFRSARVTQTLKDVFRTANSVYEIEEIQP